jgi:hypothetical protein
MPPNPTPAARIRIKDPTKPRHPLAARPYPESAMTKTSPLLLLNSRKHGIDAAQLAIHPEEIDEFNQLLEGLSADLRPTGEVQRILFGQILHASWNMRIARKHEAQALLESGPMNKNVQTIAKFYLSSERAFFRAMHELRNLQNEFAYRATLAEAEETDLPDVPPLVQTSIIHRQVRQTTGSRPFLQRSPAA